MTNIYALLTQPRPAILQYKVVAYFGFWISSRATGNPKSKIENLKSHRGQ